MNTYQSVQKWTVQTYNTGTSAWVSATSWPRGSISTFSKKYQSTTQFLNMADGSLGAFTPSTQQNLQPISLAWEKRTTTSTFRTNIKSYVTSKTGIKLTLHDSTTVQGYLLSFEEIYDFTGETQMYTVLTELQPFNVDGTGVINT